MQQRIAKQALAGLVQRGWTDGRVVGLRPGVFEIEITAPHGERCHFATLDEIRLKLKVLEAGERRGTE